MQNTPALYTDCPQTLRKYMSYMTAIRNRGSRTVKSYYTDIYLFLRFYARLSGMVPEDTPLEEIKVGSMTAEQICSVTDDDIYSFIYFLVDDRNNAAETRQHKLTSIKSFYRYLTKVEKLMEKSPAEDIEGPSLKGKETKQPIYLSVDQSERLLHAIGGESPERDYCIIVLLVNCGMRLSELTGINLSDMAETTIKIRGKGNKERTVYLNDMCTDAIGQYMDVRDDIENLVDKDALFVSARTKRRLSNRQVERMLKKHLTIAGLLNTGCTPHKLRHTAATMYYQSGAADLPELARMLGHVSTKTTEIYTHLNEGQLSEVVNHSPLNMNRKKKSEQTELPADDDK